MAGRLSTQIISTATRSIGNNWGWGNQNILSSVKVGIGPVTLRFGEGQKLLNFWDNWSGITFNTLGMLNLLTGGGIEFDENSLAFNYKGGWLNEARKFIFTEAAAQGPDPIFDADYSNIIEEGHHVWQSRIFAKLMFSTYLFNSLRGYIMDVGQDQCFSCSRWKRAYLFNFFEVQAREGWWYGGGR